MSSYFRMILSDLAKNTTFELVSLQNQSDLLSDLHRLSASLGAELVKETTRVGLDRVFADEEFLGDLPVAHSLSDQLQNLQFTFGDAKSFQPLLIQSKWLRRRQGNYLNDQHLFLSGQLETEPDSHSGEEQGNESAIDLERVLYDQKSKLNQLEQGDQNSATDSVDYTVYERLFPHCDGESSPDAYLLRN